MSRTGWWSLTGVRRLRHERRRWCTDSEQCKAAHCSSSTLEHVPGCFAQNIAGSHSVVTIVTLMETVREIPCRRLATVESVCSLHNAASGCLSFGASAGGQTGGECVTPASG